MKRVPILGEANIRWTERKPVSFEGYQQRVFTRAASDGDRLIVIVGREPLGPNGEMQWHLSMSTDGERYLTWDEIAEARERWLPDEITFAMLLPPKAEYVNLHSTTFHLHEVAI